MQFKLVGLLLAVVSLGATQDAFAEKMPVKAPVMMPPHSGWKISTYSSIGLSGSARASSSALC